MLLLVVAFSGLMLLISFSISPISTVLNNKHHGFLDVFVLNEYLGGTYFVDSIIYRISNTVWWPTGDEPIFFEVMVAENKCIFKENSDQTNECYPNYWLSFCVFPVYKVYNVIIKMFSFFNHFVL